MQRERMKEKQMERKKETNAATMIIITIWLLLHYACEAARACVCGRAVHMCIRCVHWPIREINWINQFFFLLLLLFLWFVICRFMLFFFIAYQFGNCMGKDSTELIHNWFILLRINWLKTGRIVCGFLVCCCASRNCNSS